MFKKTDQDTITPGMAPQIQNEWSKDSPVVRVVALGRHVQVHGKKVRLKPVLKLSLSVYLKVIEIVAFCLPNSY
ncbi:hypothetical protein CDAR_40031 [Caerostris darwini]|uniref:Uncharacterized protein n=1 Tax=Caerostris darwini TaxID=1538125 RepID=A0AAV4R8S5_9ARAC|nr:hypothetical protein CDAR_40031 [Caerostris darwini]